MKKILLSLGFFTLAVSGAYAQVGIGTLEPKDSAQLDVEATDKGVLIPRVELTSTAVYAPIVGEKVNSMLVYNTATTNTGTNDVTPGFYYWVTDKWLRVANAAEVEAANITNASLTVSGDKLVLTDTKGGTVDIPLTAINLAATIVDNNDGTYTFKDGKGGTDVTIDVVGDVVSNIQMTSPANGAIRTEVQNLIDASVTAAATQMSAGENTTVSGNGSTGNPYKVNVANANGNATLGVVKAAATDPIVTVTDGVLGFDAAKVTMAGDLGGTLANPTVSKLGGKNLDLAGADAAGKILTYDGAKWIVKEPATVDATDLDNKGALTLGEGLEFPSGDGTNALLKNLTVNVKAGKGIKTDAADGISVDFEANKGLDFSGDKLIVKQGNGITIDADGVNLGGTLTNPAEIVTDAANGLVIKGNGTDSANVKIKGLDGNGAIDSKLMTVDADGVVKTVDGVSVKQIKSGENTAGKVLVTKADGTVEWKEPATVDATTLTNKKALTLGDGLEFPSGDGSEALLKDLTVNVKAGKGIKTDAADGISVDFEDNKGLEFSSNNKLIVKQGNGITIDADGVNLGGTLTKPAKIVTDGPASALVIKGKDDGSGAATPADVNITLEEKAVPVNTDKLVIVDDSGNMKKVDPNAIGDRPNYKTDKSEVTTGRKWNDKDVFQKVFPVTFDSKTYANAGSEIPDNATIIGIRLQKAGGDQEVFSSARYKKNYTPNNGAAGNYIFAVYGGMSWTLNGTYNVIVEYYK